MEARESAKKGRVRVVIAKLGLDGHDRGARVVSRLLRDAGMEVIYTGIRQNPDKVCNIALQEDAHVVGISILSGAHRTLLARLMEGMTSRGLNIPVVVGGVIPDDDLDYLRSLGIAAVFAPGSPATDIVKKIDELAGQAKD